MGILLLIFFLTTTASALTCTQQWQCASVSNDYNYVDCVNGVCTCKTNLGFEGAASLDDKCRCSSTITWQNSIPYCLDFQASIDRNVEARRSAKLKGIVSSLRDWLIWPKPSIVAQKILANNLTGEPFDFYDPNVKLRADPMGQFYGVRDVTTQPIASQVWTGRAQIWSSNFTKLVANGDVVSYVAKSDFHIFLTLGGPSVYNYTLTDSGFYTFNKEDKVISIDKISHNVAWTTAPLFANATLRNAGTCTIMMGGQCGPAKDPQGYYSCYEDCMNYLANLPYGTMDDLRSDTAMCRFYYASWTLLNPSPTYCQRAGKSGGDRCISTPPASYNSENF